MSPRLLLASALLAAGLAAEPAAAGGKPAVKGGADEKQIDLAQMALPVIVNGKIKNYVFIQTRLTAASGAEAIKHREHEPFYRDALIRAAHRTSFGKPDDWTMVDERRVSAVLLAEARRISGPKAFSAAQVMKQVPRKRTGMAQPKAAAH